MIFTKFCRLAAQAVLFAAILANGSFLLAQAPFRVTTAGREFKLEGLKGRADDVPGGRRFRAGAFEEITVRGPIHLSPSSAADTKLVRLIIRFRTSDRGPALTSAELRDGSQVLYRGADASLSGDYSKRETTTPPRSANVLNLGGLRVGSDTFIRLTLGFGGGFDSAVNNGEFVLIGVEADFSLKPITGRRTIPSGGLSSATRTSPAGTVPVGSTNPVPHGVPSGVIYAVMQNNDLNWYRHDGMADGSANWGTPSKKVGSGWNVKQIFEGGDGVIYAVMPNNDLMWYRHDGIADGSFKWTGGRKVGSGWAFKQVFSGDAGVIYALDDQGQLLWYRHEGRADGSFKWTFPTGHVVATGWNFKRVFAGGGGVIYAINDDGDLFWFRHDGRNDGSAQWAAPSGQKVGSGWVFDQIFSAGGGVIYTINEQNDLMWYRHDGIGDGSARWADAAGKKVGSGWTVKQLFAGATLHP
jgi:hypothetical protein